MRPTWAGLDGLRERAQAGLGARGEWQQAARGCAAGWAGAVLLQRSPGSALLLCSVLPHILHQRMDVGACARPNACEALSAMVPGGSIMYYHHMANEKV